MSASDKHEALHWQSYSSIHANNKWFIQITPARASAAPYSKFPVLSWACVKDWHGREVLLNEVVIFVFFAHKKYSCSFKKLQLNHWCHMDYFIDVLTTFLGLEHFSCIAVYAGSERFLLEGSWILIKKILICVPKMNEDLTRLERHESE